MSSIEDKVKEGYRLLARRTLEHYAAVRGEIVPYDPKALSTLTQLRANLEIVQQSGDIRSIGDDRARNLRNAIRLFDRLVPDNLKPANSQAAFSFASDLIISYFGISSFDEFMGRIDIKSLVVSRQNAGLRIIGNPDGSVERILYVLFDPEKRAITAIVNVHELYKALQAEQQEIYQILLGMSKIKGYDRLLDVITADQTLYQKRFDIATASHDLNFFNMPEVIEKARKAKVDVKQLQAYLMANTPRMNFLICYTLGDAYIMQKYLIGRSPELQRNKLALQLYELLALIDALLAPFLQPKGKFYEVGIGLCEYMKNNPAEARILKNSAEFLRELSNTYFRR